jgi:hypothetical protein
MLPACTASGTPISSQPIGLRGSRRATTTPTAVKANTKTTPATVSATFDVEVESWFGSRPEITMNAASDASNRMPSATAIVGEARRNRRPGPGHAPVDCFSAR